MFSKIASTLRSTAAWRMSAKTTVAFAVGSAIAFADHVFDGGPRNPAAQ